MREGFAQHSSSSFVQVLIYVMRACRVHGRVLGAWSSRHLQVVSPHLKWWPSVRFIHIVVSYYFLAAERSEQKPPTERSALCVYFLCIISLVC